MALTLVSLGSDVARVGLKKLYLAEAKKYPDNVKDILGNIIETKQAYERFKTIQGLGPAEQTNEGEPTKFDDYAPLFARNFTPVKYTKGIKASDEANAMIQYNFIKNMQPQLAKSFEYKKNQVAANLNNNGFTDTTSGMNSETLYSTTHSIDGRGNNTGSNMPSTAIAFGPAGIAQMRLQMMATTNSRGMTMPFDGRILVTVPIALSSIAWTIINSDKLIGTNYNDASYAREMLTVKTINYYTSPTAWFARAEDNDMHKLFMLKQLPFQQKLLPETEDWMFKWIARESYTVGWYDWRFTWGTPGM